MTHPIAIRISLVALFAALASGCASPGANSQPTTSGWWNGGAWFAGLTGGSTKKPSSADLAKGDSAPRFKSKLNEDDAMKLAGGLAKGNEMEKQGNLAKARQTYEGLVAQFPDEPTPHHRLGVVADKERRHREAQLLFLEALDRDPNNAEIHADLGYCFYLQGKLPEAEQATLRAIQLQRRNGRFRNNLGLIYGQQEKYREALEEFRMAGSEADAFYNLAFVYASQNDADMAQKCFRQALKADPQHEPSRQALESFASFEGLPDDLKEGDDFVADKDSRPYLEGGEVPAAAEGSVGDGRVSPASHSRPSVGPPRPRDVGNLRREQHQAAQRGVSYPSTGE